MNRWIVAAAIPLVFGIALAACGESGGDTTLGDGGPCPDKPPPSAQIDADMSVEELTDLVAEAMTCPGHALHVWGQSTYTIGESARGGEFNAWLDVAGDAARSETQTRAISEAAKEESRKVGIADDAELLDTTIYLWHGTYDATIATGYPSGPRPASAGSPALCHGPGRVALAALMTCAGPPSQWGTSVERGISIENRDAIALLTEGESSDGDTTWETAARLYFDAESLLPLAFVANGLDRNGDNDSFGGVSYEHEFMTLDSLPSDFFEPASIGYEENLP